MYFNAFNTILLIILSQQCPVYSYTRRPPNRFTDKNNCAVRIPRIGDVLTPMPTSEGVEPYSGYLHVETGRYINLTCMEGKYVSIGEENTRQITTKCVRGDYLQFESRVYNCHGIKCNDIPESESPIPEDTWRMYDGVQDIKKRGPMDCFYPVSSQDYRVPILYSMTHRPTIMSPDMYGNVFVKHNTSFKVTCSSARFQMLSIRHRDDLVLTCIQHNFVLFNGTVYFLSDFRCINVPKARMTISRMRCQGNGSLAAVGFVTKERFLILYNICFDTSIRSNMYSWYRITSPYRNECQTYSQRPIFIKTKNMLGYLDINLIYKTQELLFKTTLKSPALARLYLNLKRAHFLSRGHLVARTDFFYAYEQAATFFYENTTPMWQIFNNEIWKVVEMYFRKKLASDPPARQLIITGTYGLFTLNDLLGIPQAFYLAKNPPGVPVPKFIWKIFYDIDTTHGLAFIGLNDPFSRINESSFMCETTPCPEELIEDFQNNKSAMKGLIYCCHIDAFEKVYGKLDAIRWGKNLI